jgi:hypothetical protein
VKLIVTEESLLESLDTIIMSPIEFNYLQAHPYIATAGFTEVQIDLTQRLEPMFISKLATKVVIRPIYKDFNLSPNAILVLSYLYPDKAAALRMYSMRDKNKLVELLQELSEKYQWRKI